MTEPTIEQDVEGPLRLQPVVPRPEGWRGRSVNLIAVGLVGFVVVGLILGTAFDNTVGPQRSPSAVAVGSAEPSPTPRPTRRPTPKPLPTPLPTVEINSQDLPSDRRLVYGNGLEILDLGTGALRSFGRSYEDVVWADGDTFVCVCVVRELGVNTSTAVALQFGRFDQAGKRLVERDIVTLDDIVPIPEMTEGFNVTATMDEAGETLFVVDVVRRPPVWVIELHIVDVTSGDLLDTAILDSFPVDLEEPGASANPAPRVGGAPDGVYVWGNMIAVAPDGGSVYVVAAKSEVRNDEWIGTNLEYLVPVRDGEWGEPLALPSADRQAAERWCLGRPTFADADLVVQVCSPPPTPESGQFWSVRRLTTEGESLENWPIGAVRADASAAFSLVDRERRAVYLWDAFRHLVSRVDIDTGRATEGVVEEALLPGDRGPGDRGWIGLEPGLVTSPDGTRLYALGLESGTGNASHSTGVWVFDANTLELLDHWQQRALLTSLAVSDDGRFVFAAGAAGYDADGNENHRWRASVTVYRATTGEIALLYGNIGEGQWIGFPTPN